MTTRTFHCLVGVLLFQVLYSPLAAQQQIVSIDSVPPDASPGTEISLAAIYTSDFEDSTLTGLGLRLHWDSRQLLWLEPSDVLAMDLRAVGVPREDHADFDDDDQTDRYLHLAWADLDGQWPGTGTLPAQLAVLRFEVLPGFDGSTQVQLSASSTPVSYLLTDGTTIFSSGFETGNVLEWSNSTGTQASRFSPPDLLTHDAGPRLTDQLIALAGPVQTLSSLDIPLLDIDGDGELFALSDGLLILRYLFGLTGAPLIEDAIGSGASRTTPSEIENFLQAISPALDIDLDGRRDALTDGLLVMRFLSGYQGDLLTRDAIGLEAQRTEAQDIQGFLDVLSDPEGQSDLDGDGIATLDEIVGYNILIDLDGLGTCCLTERWVTSDPFLLDSDGDGLDDLAERLLRTDPGHNDTDLDGLEDPIELDRFASAPASVDTDADSRGSSGNGIPNPLFFDGNELALFGTSPALADTDGDARSDFDEANQNATAPLVADVPRLAVELVGEVNVALEYTSTMTSETRMLESTLMGQTDTSGQSSTDSTASQQTIGASATVTAGVEAGFPGGVSASASVSATISGEYSEENTSSFTEDSSIAVQNEFQESQETAVTNSEEVTGGSLSTGVTIRNLGDVAFTLSDLGISALLRDPQDRQTFRTVATLIPAIPADGFTLGPFSGSTGVLQVEDPAISTGLATSLLADPAGLFLDVATFSLEDAEGRNFAFLSEVTNARTALLTLDFGNGDVERYRVATLVERNPDGTGAGITLDAIMTQILGIPFDTAARTGSLDPLFPNGVEVLTTVRDIATARDSDPAAYQNSFWAVLSDDPALTGADGVPFMTDFQDITLFSGDAMSLVYVTDDDRDDLFLREEFLYGTTDIPLDFDGNGTIDATEEARAFDFDIDGLSDFAEVRTGWTVNVNGLTQRRVFPDPTRSDSDRFETENGVIRGDSLTDLEEFRGRDGCGPHDPNDPSQPDPACGGAMDSGDATDPTRSDTDQDGLTDDVDDNPLGAFNIAPTINVSVDDFAANTGVLRLTGSITDPTDSVDMATIDWGDGRATCLDDASGDCPTQTSSLEVINSVDFDNVDVNHQYLDSSEVGFSVVLNAIDDRQPPGVPATAMPVTLGPFSPVLANDDVARYWMFDGQLCDFSVNFFDGEFAGNTSQSSPTSDRFGSDSDALCFMQTGGSGGTLITMDNITPVAPQLTLTAWILPSSSGSSEIHGTIVGQSDFARLVFEDDGSGDLKVTFRITNGTTETSIQDPVIPTSLDVNVISECNTQTPALSDWTFYAATVAYDGSDSTLRLYRGIGGATSVTEVDSMVLPDTEFSNPEPTLDWQIGGLASDLDACDSFSGDFCFEGRLDDIRVYDRPLSQGEIESLLIENPGSTTPSCTP